jgi:GT2 family glycosyltransferase
VTRPIHVIVVAYHAADDLDRCVATLGAHCPTTIVDNSTSADVRAVAIDRGAEYIDPGENLGFAAGANVALRRILGGPPSDVLLLNPDAAIRPRDLDKLAEYLHDEGNTRVAAISPRLVASQGSEQRVVWPFPSPLRGWAEALGLGRLPARRSFAIGAVLLLRWEALQQIGLFDERFFLYAEETDWQRRALARGWTSRVHHDVIASHAGAGTSDDPSRREALFHAAHETYIRKWYGARGWWAYRCAACLGAVVRAVVLPRDRRAEAGRRALLYFRGPCRCAGLVRDA